MRCGRVSRPCRAPLGSSEASASVTAHQARVAATWRALPFRWGRWEAARSCLTNLVPGCWVAGCWVAGFPWATTGHDPRHHGDSLRERAPPSGAPRQMPGLAGSGSQRGARRGIHPSPRAHLQVPSLRRPSRPEPTLTTERGLAIDPHQARAIDGVHGATVGGGCDTRGGQSFREAHVAPEALWSRSRRGRRRETSPPLARRGRQGGVSGPDSGGADPEGCPDQRLHRFEELF